MIREETDIKGLSARLNAQPFSNVYALSALAGYPASGGFYAAYSAGPGALVLCGGLPTLIRSRIERPTPWLRGAIIGGLVVALGIYVVMRFA